MRIVIRPVVEPQREIDLTRCLVTAIAEELWCRNGGNDQLNWIEAELHLQRIVAQTLTCHCTPTETSSCWPWHRTRQATLALTNTTAMTSTRSPIMIALDRTRQSARKGQDAATYSRINPAGRATGPTRLAASASRP